MRFSMFLNLLVLSTLVVVEGFLNSLWEKLKKGLFVTPDESHHVNHHITTGDDDHDDANGLNLNKVWEPENRKIPKHYHVDNEIVHPKAIEKNNSVIKVEFDEYNENTHQLDMKNMIGHISTIVVKENISSFVINDEKIEPAHHRHHLDNGDLVIDNHIIIPHSLSSSAGNNSLLDPSVNNTTISLSAPNNATFANMDTISSNKEKSKDPVLKVQPPADTSRDTNQKESSSGGVAGNLRGSESESAPPSHHEPVAMVLPPHQALAPLAPAPPPAPRVFDPFTSLRPPAPATTITLPVASIAAKDHAFHQLWGMGHNKTHVGQHHRHHKGAGYEPYVPNNGKKYSSTEPKAHAAHDSYEFHIHQSLKDIDTGACKIVFIGDSVLSQISRDLSIRERLSTYHPINLASPGFRTEHMLFRLTTSAHVHRIFESPLFIVMIGTFNIGIHDSPDATKEGIMTIVGNIVKFSNHNSSRVVVCSILPRHSASLNKEIDQTNTMIASAIKGMDRIHFLNLDSLFKGNQKEKKMLNDNLFMPDHLHPSEHGYNAIIGALRTFLMPLGSGAFQLSVRGDGDVTTNVEDSSKSKEKGKKMIVYGVSNNGERDVKWTRAEAAKMAAEAVAKALGPAPVHIKPADIISAARQRNAARTEKGKAIKEKLRPLDKELQAMQWAESTTKSVAESSRKDKVHMFSSSPNGVAPMVAPIAPTKQEPALAKDSILASLLKPVNTTPVTLAAPRTKETILKEFQEFLKMKQEGKIGK